MYVVLIGLVLIVYARFLPKKEAEAPKANVVQEIEDTIGHFAAEMDEQNQAILDLFTRTKQDYEVELAKLAGRLESLEKQKSELSQELSKVHMNQQASMLAGSGFVESAGGEQADDQAQKLKAAELDGADSGSEPAVEADKEEAAFGKLNMKTRYAELFSLYDQGKGIETIAKKLGMNKGEVNLILQLSRQEEQSRV